MVMGVVQQVMLTGAGRFDLFHRRDRFPQLARRRARLKYVDLHDCICAG